MARVTAARSRSRNRASARNAGICLLGICLTAVGCGHREPQFSPNLVYLRLQERQTGTPLTPRQVRDIAAALTSLFGTPDAPTLPDDLDGLHLVLDLKRLQLAAGPVGSDQQGQSRGLYRQHCVACHGISGDGRGPTASFQNPYPRDFRPGMFKFKSTPTGSKPTDADLHRRLINGIAGTSMPSFRLLAESEIEALIAYVKYLSIRGDVERQLIVVSEDFRDPDDPKADRDLWRKFLCRENLVQNVLSKVVQSWQQVDSQIPEVPERPSAYEPDHQGHDRQLLQESIERGRKLYALATANCFSCHGTSQQGDGLTSDYDMWTKEFFDWTKTTDPAYSARWNEYLGLGGLPPRPILPRNLTTGVFRGGEGPVDIYRRIRHGIEGTPMPAANLTVLTSNDLWDLVNFVLSLSAGPENRG